MQAAQNDALKLMQLIRAFMTHGHLEANLDPLKLNEAYGQNIAGRSFNPGQRLRELIDP